MKTPRTLTIVSTIVLMIFAAVSTTIARAGTTLYVENYEGEPGFPTTPEVDVLELGGLGAVTGGATAVLPPLPVLTGDRVAVEVVSTGGTAYPNENASTATINARALYELQEPFSLTGRFEHFDVTPNDGSSDGLVTMLLWNTTTEYFVGAIMSMARIGTTLYPSINIQEWTPAGVPGHILGVGFLPNAPITGSPFDVSLIADPATNTVRARFTMGDQVVETPPLILSYGNLQDPQLDSVTQTLVVNNASYFNAGPGNIAKVEFRDFRVTTPVNHARIDVRPLTSDNTINTSLPIPTPVAIFSTPEFDASTIDPASLSLGGAPVATSPRGQPLCQKVNVDRDRLKDLLCAVVTARINAPLGASHVKLTATTIDGSPVIGTDSIRRVR